MARSTFGVVEGELVGKPSCLFGRHESCMISSKKSLVICSSES